MANFRQYNRHKKKAFPVSSLLRVIDVVAFTVTIVCSVMLVMAYLAQVVNPNDVWVFAVMGLIAPILFIINIAIALYWLIRWSWKFIIPLATILVGIGSMTLYFQPQINKTNKTISMNRDMFTVVSYNVAGFIDRHKNIGKSSVEPVLEFVNSCQPSILAMQEYQTTGKITQRIIDSLLVDLPYKKVAYRIEFSDTTGWGIAIFSKYPIIKSGIIEFAQNKNSAMWADVVINKDTVRVFNNHLQTTSINESDRDFITTELVGTNTDSKSRKIRSILGKLRNNYRIRADQADSVARQISISPYPVLVCGDFNDTPMSYTYNTISGDLHDSFRQKGIGLHNTYRGLFNLFRIDYILHSSVFQTISYESPESEWSDHNAVRVIVQRKSK